MINRDSLDKSLYGRSRLIEALREQANRTRAVYDPVFLIIP